MDEEEVRVVFSGPKAPRGQTGARQNKEKRCSSCFGPIHDQSETNLAANGFSKSGAVSGSDDKHCHELKKGPELDKAARKKLIIACVLSLLFMIGEVAGGIFANSLAIVSDAAHLLTDFASFLISLLAIYLASRRATTNLSFGWYRAEILGALMSILFLWVVTGVLVYMAIQRVIHQDYEIDAMVMLITAGCGVGFNIVMGCSLHTHGHSHGGAGHGHGHNEYDDDEEKMISGSENDVRHSSYGTIDNQQQTTNKKKKEHKHTNINVRAAFIHVMGDLLQSVGVFAAALIIYLKPEAKLADPICTFLFSVFVIFTTMFIMRDILLVLMEGKPRGLSYDDIRESLCKVEGVKDIHDLRIWSLSLNKLALSVHIAVDSGTDPHAVLQRASLVVQKSYGITETTMQVEEFVEDMLDCTHCRDLKD